MFTSYETIMDLLNFAVLGSKKYFFAGSDSAAKFCRRNFHFDSAEIFDDGKKCLHVIFLIQSSDAQ